MLGYGRINCHHNHTSPNKGFGMLASHQNKIIHLRIQKNIGKVTITPFLWVYYTHKTTDGPKDRTVQQRD